MKKLVKFHKENLTKASEQILSDTRSRSCLTTPEIEEFEAKLKFTRVS